MGWYLGYKLSDNKRNTMTIYSDNGPVLYIF